MSKIKTMKHIEESHPDDIEQTLSRLINDLGITKRKNINTLRWMKVIFTFFLCWAVLLLFWSYAYYNTFQFIFSIIYLIMICIGYMRLIMKSYQLDEEINDLGLKIIKDIHRYSE